MNANLLINAISFPLASNKLDEVKRVLLSLPWESKDNPTMVEKILVGPRIFGRWSESPDNSQKNWFMSVELTIGEYYIVFRTHNRCETEFKNKISWRRVDDVLAQSKEW